MRLVEFTLGSHPDQQVFVNPTEVVNLLDAKVAEPAWEPPDRQWDDSIRQYTYINLKDNNFVIVECPVAEAAFAINEALESK